MAFSIQALATLGSGWLLLHWQWHGIIYACIPLILGLSALLLWKNKNKKAI
jgi:hypothetical protein